MSRFDDARRRSRLARALRRVGRRLSGAPARQRPGQGVPIEFRGSASGTTPSGSTVLSAAMQLGLDLSHYCGGTCSCGTCRVEILLGAEHLSSPRGNETMVLGAEHLLAGDRLACQARVLGPVVVRVPEWF